MYASFHKIVSPALLAFALGGHAHATGDFTTPTMFENGARRITGTPEFFWELECKRIAGEFVATEKRLPAPAIPTPPDAPDNPDTLPPDAREEFTTKTDLTDFKEALTNGSLKPADPAAAIAAHAAAREVIKQANLIRNEGRLPDEAPGEFADYHKGALAYKTHRYPEARAAWEALLARPAAERKYRSTWAAYMLGRCALDEKQFEQAATRFQQTRKLAAEGLADSIGLAAESYGWEARCELELGHAEAAARLYLTQLALGDPSAVVSLKWFVPDWGLTVKGDESETIKPGQYLTGDDPEPAPSPQATPPRGAAAFDAAARSPLLRRLVSCHILATHTWYDVYGTSENSEEGSEAQRKWLKVLDQAGVSETPDAEYIGWLAYSAGKYDDAKQWLAKSAGTSPAALWLKAKFLLRDGNIAEGTRLLSQAIKALPAAREQLENSVIDGNYTLPSDTATGELGLLRLAQSDFIQALDAFIAAGFWGDAAYLAERCLTKNELLDYARNRKYAAAAAKQPAKEYTGFSEDAFRDLVARRMVREDDYQTAREFFKPDKIKALDNYAAALAKAADKKLSKQQQARALFHAAWIARYQGLELMGTELGPDNALSGGAFNEGNLAMERLTGKTAPTEDGAEAEGGEQNDQAVRFVLPVTDSEKERLRATKLTVELRFHYRHVAAGLAWKAAGLLPDNSPEAADVLNTAGNWLKVKHEKQARRFFQAIKSRCAKTELGKLAVTKGWFVSKDGPWSAEERKAMPVE